MPPKKAAGHAANKPYSRADPISPGEIVTDNFKKQWKFGKPVGSGGFGEIYLASDEVSKSVNDKANYVIKIEPYSNGPLFVEIAFYIRVGKAEMIEEWKGKNKCDLLGMPPYIASGQHDYKGQQYRFLVIPRYGQDLYKILQEKPGKVFGLRTVQGIALQIIDTLEYIHSKDYIHGDIKASNLMLGFVGAASGAGKKKPPQQVYLLDYGLAAKFVNSDGSHAVYAPDARRAHNGTLEYTSRDAHIGAYSRRGDLEILGYNMLEWLCGKLPWTRDGPPERVHEQKKSFMSNINLKKLYPGDIQGLDMIDKVLKYVAQLKFDERPNYAHLRDLIRKGLPSSSKGCLFLDDVTSNTPPAKISKAAAKRLYQNGEAESSAKKVRGATTEEKKTTKRSTRTTRKVKDFNWARVLSSDPEKLVRAASSLSQSSSEKDDSISSKTPSPVISNPTPAMLQILSKKKENIGSPLKTTPLKARSIPPPEEGSPTLTPAMKEILILKRKKLALKSKKDAVVVVTLPLPLLLGGRLRRKKS